MDEFLDSEKFYQMAREYNTKYNSISTLSAENFDEAEFVKILENIHKFIYIVRVGFVNNKNFKTSLQKISSLEKMIEQIEMANNFKIDKNFENSQKDINNLACLKLIFDTAFLMFQAKKSDNCDQLENLAEKFFDCVLTFYSAF